MSVEELTALALETGKYGVRGMELLDAANTNAYGNPEITKVNIGTGTRPGILVSGHDLRDLEMLLMQTKDWELTYIRIQRCFRRIIIRHLKIFSFCWELR